MKASWSKYVQDVQVEWVGTEIGKSAAKCLSVIFFFLKEFVGWEGHKGANKYISNFPE